MSEKKEIICIGSVLWDVIGRTERDMPPGADRPGRIDRLPGGVAMNIAMALARFGLAPRLLTHIGRDDAGDELIAAAEGMGLDASLVERSDALPTDQYMAIEGPEGLVAAVADAHALEAAGARILKPLEDGRLGDATRPYEGTIALDGNLTERLLAEIAVAPALAAADIRLAPASPGKAKRLAPLLRRPRTTLYVNLEEAGLIAADDGAAFETAEMAAKALVEAGSERVLVTDGPRAACAASGEAAHIALPPPTSVRRVTGAGDMFMAAHIAADLSGAPPEAALRRALDAAAAHVGSETAP
ncbi:MAG: PfkB family carbohydrate kinase [Pseudomonadota bacterium]